MLRTAPPGGVVLASLATGGGKTLTYLLPLLEQRELRGRAGALVIVPTISLAVDQADALSRRYPSAIGRIRATEVHSALVPLVRNEREEEFLRGDCDILLVSPERALRPDFVERLRSMKEQLTFLIIDEAHTLVDWGESFRLDYPRLGWLRRELVQGNPGLRTHLMSATVPRRVERQLKAVFSVEDGLWRTVRGSAMRFEAEIQIQALEYRSHKSSLIWLQQHVPTMPTPALIYVTRPSHAEQIGAALTAWGYRCGVYHGNSAEEDRQMVSKQWIDGGLEYVVATSAFGLGIDKPNVRSVTHLCIPESLDRYYQEIGRAGRDGERCFANLVTVEEDIEIAYRNAKRLLTPEKFSGRWEDLINHGSCLEDTGDEVYWLIDETRRPKYAPPVRWYEGSPSDLHTKWNRSLLNYLQRLGFLSYEGPFPVSMIGTATADANTLIASQGWQLRRREVTKAGDSIRLSFNQAPGPTWRQKKTQMFQLSRTVEYAQITWQSLFKIDRRAIDQTPEAVNAFLEITEQRRQAEMADSYSAISRMVKFARSTHNGCYRAPIGELYGEHVQSCGNCGWCIAGGLQRSLSSEPEKPSPWNAGPVRVRSGIKNLAGTCGMVLVSYGGQVHRNLVARFEQAGFRQFLVPEGVEPSCGVIHGIDEFTPDHTVFERLPTVVIIPASFPAMKVGRVLGFLSEDEMQFSADNPCMILLPDSLAWPGRESYLEKFTGQRATIDLVESILN